MLCPTRDRCICFRADEATLLSKSNTGNTHFAGTDGRCSPWRKLQEPGQQGTKHGEASDITDSESIELLHCAESIKTLLYDPDITSSELVAKGEKRYEGIGVIEAPRGTLFHHYQIDENDIVTKANLIVSTTSNNMAMNESVRQVAAQYLSGRELTEPLLNNLEVAIRAYDPCLSCATHAVGKMPLQLEVLDAQGQLLDRLIRNHDGEYIHQL